MNEPISVFVFFFAGFWIFACAAILCLALGSILIETYAEKSIREEKIWFLFWFLGMISYAAVALFALAALAFAFTSITSFIALFVH